MTPDEAVSLAARAAMRAFAASPPSDTVQLGYSNFEIHAASVADDANRAVQALTVAAHGRELHADGGRQARTSAFNAALNLAVTSLMALASCPYLGDVSFESAVSKEGLDG